ncbi:MAG: hypothetical protein LBV74_16550 [Tannerella sp.]|jgi:hypothetical protein|nr:hypothetical protein [Tannerella sp.]
MKEQSKMQREFNMQINRQIIVYQNIIEGFNTVIPVLGKFSNKVINVRFVNALKEANTVNGIIFSIEDGKFLKVSQMTNKSYTSPITQRHVYLDNARYLQLVISDVGRLQLNETLDNLHDSVYQLNVYINHCMKEIDTYDQFENDLTALIQCIKNFEEKHSITIRDFHLSLKYYFKKF